MGCTEIYSPYIDISMYLEAVLLQTVVLSCQMESIFFLKYVINEGYWGEYFIGVIWILLTFWVSPNWAKISQLSNLRVEMCGKTIKKCGITYINQSRTPCIHT